MITELKSYLKPRFSLKDRFAALRIVNATYDVEPNMSASAYWLLLRFADVTIARGRLLTLKRFCRIAAGNGTTYAPGARHTAPTSRNAGRLLQQLGFITRLSLPKNNSRFCWLLKMSRIIDCVQAIALNTNLKLYSHISALRVAFAAEELCITRLVNSPKLEIVNDEPTLSLSTQTH